MLAVAGFVGIEAPRTWAGPPPLRAVYFVPADREPLSDFSNRLDRVMTEVQQFYRREMEAAGHGPRTFELERDAGGKLMIHLVRGREPMRAYGRSDSAKVKQEVGDALRARGWNPDRETIVIFQVLLAWENGRAVEIGPYCGSGNHRSGTAWVYDDERLDPRYLASKEPGGFYAGRPCSLGEFNTHYIGGVAHELGHAFGLPHDCERESERARRGRSLMGGGNHTYGQELRGEGPGTFLSDASALQLLHTRPFAGDLPDSELSPTCEWAALDVMWESNRLILTGQVVAHPPVYGIVALNDSTANPNDYDAVGWIGAVSTQGAFRIEIAELRPGPYQLRLLACHANGAKSRWAVEYKVYDDGSPDLTPFRVWRLLRECTAAWSRRDGATVQRLAREARERWPDLTKFHRALDHMLALLNAPLPRVLDDWPDDVPHIPLSRTVWERASTGWGPPLRDHVRLEGDASCLLQVGGEWFDEGLYAHAPSVNLWRLDGRWSRLRASYGLQDGHFGSTVFVVRCDRQERFRSPVIRDGFLRSLEVDVRGVRELELITENGGDGSQSDWAVWIAPRLIR